MTGVQTCALPIYDPLLDKHIIERRRKQTQTLGEAAAQENEQIKLLQV